MTRLVQVMISVVCFIFVLFICLFVVFMGSCFCVGLAYPMESNAVG